MNPYYLNLLLVVILPVVVSLILLMKTKINLIVLTIAYVLFGVLVTFPLTGLSSQPTKLEPGIYEITRNTYYVLSLVFFGALAFEVKKEKKKVSSEPGRYT